MQRSGKHSDGNADKWDGIMSDTPEIEFLGNTANKAFAGHAFVKGQPIAALMLKLPPDFWQANENKNGRGRPSGAAKERVLRDIKTLAARDIVDAVLKRDGMTAAKFRNLALDRALKPASISQMKEKLAKL